MYLEKHLADDVISFLNYGKTPICNESFMI